MTEDEQKQFDAAKLLTEKVRQSLSQELDKCERKLDVYRSLFWCLLGVIILLAILNYL